MRNTLFPWFANRVCIATIVFLCLTVNALAGYEKGPLHVRNQFPPHLMFLTPQPDSPNVVPEDRFKFSLSADYSSVFVNETSANWSALIDMEMTVLDVSLEYGMMEYLTLSLDIPLVSMGGGFLDGFLEDYHDTFGFPNYGREKRPKNEFAYSLRKNRQEWFSAESGGLHLADGSISAKLSLVDEETGLFQKARFSSTSVSLAYTLKIPVGDEDRGFSSGGPDHGFSVLSQFRFSSFALYLNPSVIFLSDPQTSGPDISVNTIFGIFAGGEYALSDSWTLAAQLNYYTSPFENTGISQLDDDSLELGLGFTCELTPAMSLEFAFCEDLTHSVPDFNIHARVVYEIGN